MYIGHALALRTRSVRSVHAGRSCSAAGRCMTYFHNLCSTQTTQSIFSLVYIAQARQKLGVPPMYIGYAREGTY